MSEIYAVYNQMRNCSDAFRNDGDHVRSVCSSMDSMIEGLDNVISTTVSRFYKARLRIVNQKMLEAASKMDTFSSAVQMIANSYLSTDQAVAGSEEPIPFSIDSQIDGMVAAVAAALATLKERLQQFIEQIMESIRLSLIDIGLLPAREQHRVDGEAVTHAQEREQDQYLRQQINALARDERYSENTWRRSTPEQRQQLLNDYIVRVAAIMGLDINTVHPFNEQPDSEGYITMGYFSDTDNSVHINSWVIANGDDRGYDSYGLYTTVTHELRHAYQYAAIQDPERFVLTEETISRWNENWYNYKGMEDFMAEGMNEREAFEAYRAQAVEEDARWFAGQD